MEELEKRVLKVLKSLKEKPPDEIFTDDIRHPSSISLRLKAKFDGDKINAVKDSFDVKEITKETKKSRKENGKAIHREFERLINDGSRKGEKGNLLKKLEKEFKCKFIKAEADIWGWAITKSKVTYYSGRVDAIALRERREPDNPARPAEPEVLVVEWKTSDKKDVPENKWWTKSGNFRDPLYQSLVYRELLSKHLERERVEARVGIMLVPYQQSEYWMFTKPGLCKDFEKMDRYRLLDGIKKYRWVSDKSEVVHTLSFSDCKLFKEEVWNDDTYVDQSTKILKDEAPLTDILTDAATVGDLQRELGLLSLKFTQ